MTLITPDSIPRREALDDENARSAREVAGIMNFLFLGCF